MSTIIRLCRSAQKGYAFFLFLAATVFICPVWAEETEQLLLGEQYYANLHQAFQQAKHSIWVEMYFIGMRIDTPDDPADILIKDLVDAKNRGVDVKVILEDRLFDKNYIAYNTLGNAGIEVYLDSPISLLHSKAIIIDEKLLFIGSANWSKSAFYSNDEVSVLIESPKLAAQLAAAFKNIKLSKEPPIKPFQYKGVKIPKQLLEEKNKLPMLLTKDSQKAFDLYLLLLKESQESNSATVGLNYEKLAKLMHYKLPARDFKLKRAYTKFFYFFNIYQPLKKLTRSYNLLERQPWSKNVTIIDFTPAEKDGFILPFEYWEYGLDKQLSFSAKFVWLVALLEASQSQRNPYWFRSQKDLAEKYHIGERAIGKGLLKLEKEELLEVFRHIPEDPSQPEKRPANDYRLNPLVSQADFKNRLESLAGIYGADLLNKAQGLSAQLGQPKDLNKIETYIGLINKFGYEDVRQATSQACQKRLESGLRSLSYVISLLETQP